MHGKGWITSALVFIILLFIQPWQTSLIYAESERTYAYETPLSGSGAALSGVMASKSFFFQIDRHWDVQNIQLELEYATTPLAINEYSSITMYINGTAFYSFRPQPGNGEKQRLQITVPAESAITGVNTVTLSGDVRTQEPDNACVYGDQRDNWFQLYPSSGITVHYLPEPLDGGIRSFHAYITGLSVSGSGGNAIVVPGDAEPSELEAAVYVLSGLAKASSHPEYSIPLMSYSDFSAANKQAAAVIALWEHLPEPMKELLQMPESMQLDREAWIQTAKLGDTELLIVTSANAELLVKAGRFLANGELTAQLSSGSKAVNAATEVGTKEAPVSRTVQLTPAGDRLSGFRHQEQSYYLAFPANRSIAEGSRVDLSFRYAANLNFERSLVTILLNDQPIGSKRLSETYAGGDHLSVVIPANAGISGNFSLKVAFDLELDYAGCMQVQEDMPWAFIDSDSHVRLNMRDQTELLFNHYPSPYLRDGRFNDIAVVLPQPRNRYTYSAISNLFHLLGRYAEANTGHIFFVEGDVPAERLEGRHIIAIGSYEDNAVIRANNERLYFKYDKDGSGFISNEKMSIEESYGQRIGTLQLIDSPYTAGYSMLAVTGAAPESPLLASRLLESDAVRWQVYGDAVVTDRDGNTGAYRFKEQADSGGQSMLEGLRNRPDALGFIAAGALTLLLILISMVMLLRKHTPKRRDGNES